VKNILLITSLSFISLTSSANLLWEPEQHQHHTHHRGKPGYFLSDPKHATTTLIAPDLTTRNIKLKNGVAKPRPTGMNNYHALLAERHSENLHEAAIRYITMRGKKTRHSPFKLVNANKTELEIIPAPLPREHRRYHSGTDIVFELRFKGWQLNNVPVTLKTSNGSVISSMTDVSGQVKFSLPEDFVQVKPGRRNNPAQEFTISTEYTRNSDIYRSSLSMPYYVNPTHWQSNTLAMTFAGSGFIVGLGVMAYSRKNNKKDKS